MAEPIIVTTPDGQEFEFPAGTSQDVMKSAMQKHFGKPPESMFGVKLPNQQQFAELMTNAQQREAATAQELVDVGKNVVARRKRMQSDPFRRYNDRVTISMDGKDPAPATNYAELGANEIGASQGLTFNLGDEVLGLLKGDEARAQRQRLINYAKDTQPAAFGEGQAMGAGFNALATLPVALPAKLNVARALPLGPRGQAVATGALSGSLWDTAWQMAQGEGSFVDRLKDTDKTQTAITAGVAGGVSGLITALINPVSKEASALSDVLDGVLDTNGAVSPDGLRALERFLSDMGVPLDDVTLGRINTVIKDYSQAGSKTFTLPMRIKDVLVEALDGGSGKIREAIKSQLRGTQAMGEEGGATIQKSVDEDYAAARQGMYDQYGSRLGQKRRIDSEEGTLAELRKIGEEGYEPILSQGPTTYQGARSLDEVLNGPGMQSGELMTPLKQYANAEGFELVDFIKQNPLKAAHWMQSKARELVDSGQKQYAKLRERLLGAIEDAAPGYNAIRKKYGDEYGNLEALDFGDRFLTNAGKDFEIDKMARAFKELSPAQKRVALLSVRDVLRTATGKGKGTTPPRTSKVGEEQVKEALETVFGARGARVAQDIEKLDDYLYLRTDVDIRRRGSQTAPLGEDIKTATTRVQSPFRRKVGNFITGLAGDAALTSTGLPPINAMRRGAVSVGRWVGGDQGRKLNAFATLLEAPIKRAQQRVATQRATPPKGPDGKFISRERAAELGIEVDTPAQTVPANIAAKRGGVAPILSNPDLQAALAGGFVGGMTPDEEGNMSPMNAALGALAGVGLRRGGAAAGNAFRQVRAGPRAASSGPLGGRVPRELPMDEASRMQRARDMGFDTETTWYHGANRMDRIAEGNQFDPKRATSGPMAFFTDNPQIASNYAKGKADNSLADSVDQDSIRNWFTTTIRGKEKPAEMAWYSLSPAQKAEITDNYFRLGYANPDEATGGFVVHPKGVDGSIAGRDHLQYLLDRHRGNPLAAMRELWAESGTIFGEEHLMKELYRKVGLPFKVSDKNAPYFEAPGIVPAQLKIQNPVRTNDPEQLREIAAKLRQEFPGEETAQRINPWENGGVDPWDKRAITPRQWIEDLENDMLKGEQSFVFTRVPDEITAALRRMGYDGFMDMGGKMGGETHRVAVPFGANQVRSKFARFDPEQSDSPILTAGIGGRRRSDIMKELAKPDANGQQFPVIRRVSDRRRPQPPEQIQSRMIDGEAVALPLLLGGIGTALAYQYMNRERPPVNAFGGVMDSIKSGAQRAEQGFPFPPSVKPDLSRVQESAKARANQDAYVQGKRDEQAMYEAMTPQERNEWRKMKEANPGITRVRPEDAARGVIDKRLLPDGRVLELIDGQWVPAPESALTR